MLRKEMLLESIDASIRVCEQATPADEFGKLYQIFERGWLRGHRDWIGEAGEDQTALQQILDSLEKNTAAMRHQRVREESAAS